MSTTVQETFIGAIPPQLSTELSQMKSLLRRETGEILSGLSTLEALADSARQSGDSAGMADVLDFVVSHLYPHVNALVEYPEDFDAKFKVKVV